MIDETRFEEHLGELFDELARDPEPLEVAEVRPDAVRERRRHRIRRQTISVVPAAVVLLVATAVTTQLGAPATIVGTASPASLDTTRGTDEADLALLDAVRAGSHAHVAHLLDNGADPSRTERHGMSPLLIAAVRGDIEMGELLIDAGGRRCHQPLRRLGARARCEEWAHPHGPLVGRSRTRPEPSPVHVERDCADARRRSG